MIEKEIKKKKIMSEAVCKYLKWFCGTFISNSSLVCFNVGGWKNNEDYFIYLNILFKK